ncbi:MAG: GYF domain-containing protein [Planctomycetota bacterium]|nr:GYF domain-containing protein [Planctomycetota bacterium]
MTETGRSDQQPVRPAWVSDPKGRQPVAPTVPVPGPSEWFYWEGGPPLKGPLTFADLKRRVMEGEVRLITHVRRREQGDWREARMVPDLFPYTAEICRDRPSCLLFLVDQSESMDEPFGGQSGQKKSDALAIAINRQLYNLVIVCNGSEGILDYFHVGVIGYGSRVDSAWGGKLVGRTLVRVSEIAAAPIGMEKRPMEIAIGGGKSVTKNVDSPIWIKPEAAGTTPMCEALALAKRTVQDFIENQPACYPPIVINLTDGGQTDGAPEPHAEALRALTSTNGNVVLFNAHISSHTSPPIEFPMSEEELPTENAQLLFRMSSRLPPPMQQFARLEGYNVTDDTRGLVFNADLVVVYKFLDLGTRRHRNLR